MGEEPQQDVKVTVSRETRRKAKLLAGHWDVSIKDAVERAILEALERAAPRGKE